MREIVALIFLTLAIGATFRTLGQVPLEAAAAASPQCNSSIWSHVYTGDPKIFSKPQDRLKVIKDCITVTGTIRSSKKEKDGDFHMQIELDPQYLDLLNDKNGSKQKGMLVIEPVCQTEPTQKDTVSEGVCNGFRQDLHIPKKGTHVSITGVYVTDMEHGWNEIHPVTSITAD